MGPSAPGSVKFSLARFVTNLLDLVQAETLAARRGAFRFGTSVVAVALGGILGLAGVGVMAAGVIVALDEVLSTQLALLIAGCVLCVIGGGTSWIIFHRMTKD